MPAALHRPFSAGTESEHTHPLAAGSADRFMENAHRSHENLRRGLTEALRNSPDRLFQSIHQKI